MTAAPGRRSSTFTRLLRHGFTDASAAERLLDSAELAPLRDDPVLLDALGATADPDLALLGLVRLLEAQPEPGARRELLDTLISSKPLRDRLLGVLGASTALADHLTRHPDDWQALVMYEAHDLHPGVEEFEDGLAQATDPVSLRVAYRRCLLSIAARDVCGTTGVAESAAELADLATATLRAALGLAGAAAPEDAALCRLAVIAMGKCGGHELNYVSDVDVIFVGEAVEGADETKAVRAATRLASHMMRICSETTVEGSIWPVDANLRPEGRNGPLVRTLSSHLAYYQRWAKTWEFQALLKARPVAGDLDLGAEYVAAVQPLVWKAAERENFVPDVQKMRRRVVENIRRRGRPPAEAGPGRPQGRRVRRAAPPVGARPDRHLAAQRHHPRRAEGARRRRVRRPGRRRPARRGLPLPALHGAPDPAVPAAAHPPRARGRGGAAPHRPPSACAPTRSPSCSGSGSGTPPSYGVCTRSCSTGRCSTRSPNSPPVRRG
ncbi:Bifunctional glutamine synthetase adenylyltransferase/adenylyl-removing enzyme [Streptomyces violarus]